MITMNEVNFKQQKDVAWGLWEVRIRGRYAGMMHQKASGEYVFSDHAERVRTTGDSQLMALNKAEWYLKQQGQSLC